MPKRYDWIIVRIRISEFIIIKQIFLNELRANVIRLLINVKRTLLSIIILITIIYNYHWIHVLIIIALIIMFIVAASIIIGYIINK